MRRPLIILALVLIVIALLVAGYFVFFAGKSAEQVVDDVFNPFGVSDGQTPGAVAEPKPNIGEVASGAGEEVAPRLIKITSGPVALGAGVITVQGVSQTASTTPDTEIRYIERESGHVYAFRVGERTLTRLTNRTLPGVHEAIWLANGTSTYARFLSDDSSGIPHIETFSLPASEMSGYFLESDLSDVAVLGSRSVLTVLPSSTGSTGTLANVDGSSAKTLFSSPLSSLNVLPAGTNFGAYTKASAQSLGYGFTINGTSGVFERVLGPLRGFTMLPSPSGKSILYTYLSGSSVRTEVLDVATRTSTTIPLGALSEKCVWAPDETSIYCAVPRSFPGTIPDDWYQGVVSFSDRIWKIDLVGQLAILVIDPDTVAQESIDAVALTIDPLAMDLVFTNRKDGSLWVYSF